MASRTTLQQASIALVVQGGGAKGAYQVGVWKALWAHGIRKFTLISGTSVGALNGLLISTSDPDEVERVWRDLIAKGILQRRKAIWKQLLSISFGYLLIFLPGILAIAVAYWADTYVEAKAPAHGWAALMLIVFGAVIHRDAGVLLTALERRVVIGFIARHLQGYRKLGFYSLWLGVFGLVSAVITGTFTFSGSVVWLAAGFFFASFWLMNYGRVLTHRKLTVDPIFGRKPLLEEIRKRCKSKVFPHCTGDVIATVGHLKTFKDPFAVDPGKPNPEAAFGPDPAPWEAMRWRYHPEASVTAWCPHYVRLNGAGDSSWALEASSAIPFVFSTVVGEKNPFGDRPPVYVDGGVADNMPIIPALQSAADAILVLGCNYTDELPDQDEVEKVWREYWFSSDGDSAAIDEVRARYVNEPNSKQQLSPSMSGRTIYLLKPSRYTVKHLSIPLLDSVLDTVTGTLRFDQAYMEELIRLGESDTQRWLAQLSP